MTYKKKDITKAPIDFPPNLADKEKLNPNEERLAFLKKLHRETHKMVEINEVKKVYNIINIRCKLMECIY